MVFCWQEMWYGKLRKASLRRQEKLSFIVCQTKCLLTQYFLNIFMRPRLESHTSIDFFLVNASFFIRAKTMKERLNLVQNVVSFEIIAALFYLPYRWLKNAQIPRLTIFCDWVESFAFINSYIRKKIKTVGKIIS